MHGTAYANKAVIDCDLIMAIGARWDDRITGKLSEFCLDAIKIHIDIDRAEFNKIVRPDVSLAGDARLVIEDLLPLVDKLRHRRLAEADRRLAQAVPAQVPEAGRPARAARARPARRARRARLHHHHRRRPAPDVGGAVLPDDQEPPLALVGRRRHDGLRLPGGDRRAVRQPGQEGLVRSSATAASR